MTSTPADPRLHGDRLVGPGMRDFAVNVWPTPRPAALQSALQAALAGDRYPDPAAAVAAVAGRHERPTAQVLALNGACEAFWLIAHALRPRRAVCVHPAFTEPEVALRAVGAPVEQVVRPADDWRLEPGAVPPDADLVVLANPNNPTGILDAPDVVAQLARPGRTLVVDESFVDFAGEEHSLAGRRDLPGLVVVRSLTKLWALPGLRAGYLVAPEEIVERLAGQRQPWSVNAAALAAIATCAPDTATPPRVAAEVAAARRDLAVRLRRLSGLHTWPSEANFVLCHHPDGAAIVRRLAAGGIAVRPCHTFPGLDADHIRLAVRRPADHAQLADALARAIAVPPGDRDRCA